jgi:hypothetical protein
MHTLHRHPNPPKLHQKTRAYPPCTGLHTLHSFRPEGRTDSTLVVILQVKTRPAVFRLRVPPAQVRFRDL